MTGPIISDAGVHAVGLRVTRDLGWLFRDQPVADFGIDAHIEVTAEDGYPKGQLIGVQIKSGDAYFREIDPSGGFVFRGKHKHLNYWLRHVLPVIVVLYHPHEDVCYWQVVSPETVSHTDKAWKLVVPKNQRLDASAQEALSELTDLTKEPHEQRLAQLLVEKPLMDALSSGERLLLYVEEWVNKSSGRGSLRLFTETSAGQEQTVSDWPFVMFPGWDYPQLLAQLFPWARISVDEDFYYDYEEEQYDLENSIWDGEEGRYFRNPMEYPTWRARLPRIRPYDVASGEVAKYRLELALNDIGRAFLNLVPYLTEGSLPPDLCYSHGTDLNDEGCCDQCYKEAVEEERRLHED